MAQTTRKKYSQEFKLEATKLVWEQGFSCVEIAQQLNVADQNISHWATTYEQSLQMECSGERSHSELEAELSRLRAEKMKSSDSIKYDYMLRPHTHLGGFLPNEYETAA